MPEKPSDDYDRLHKALLALGEDDGVTVPGDTAIKTARRILTMLELALIKAEEDGTDTLVGVNEPPPGPE